MTVPALTLTQPTPALVEAGVVSMLTRSSACPAELIGGRLILHAAQRPPREHDRVGTWVCTASAAAWWMRDGEPGWPDRPLEDYVRLSLGAVVASCVVEDCIPILDGVQRARTGRWIRRYTTSPLLLLQRSYARENVNIDDQLPFGDFSPGNFAWILSDVEPTSHRCPHCWGGKRQPDDRPGSPRGLHGHLHSWMACPTCDGRGTCPPIPMRGHSGLWYPKWEDDRA